MPVATFDTPGLHTYDVSGLVEIQIALYGAKGEDTTDWDGGLGGKLEATVDVSAMDEVAFGVPDGSLAYGLGHDGGDGATDTGDGGDGGASCVIQSGTTLIGEAGGGGGALDGDNGGGGGGSGGRGGSASFSGDDAEGDRDSGGDGGGTGAAFTEPGDPGTGIVVDGTDVVSHTATTGDHNSRTGQAVIVSERGSEPPSNLTVSTDSEDSLSLAWDSDVYIDEFDVYRSESPGVDTSDTLVATVSSESYTDTGLTNGREYFYVVTNADETALSNEDSAATDVPAPTIDVADGGDRDATLEWTLNDDNLDGGVDVLRDGSLVTTLDRSTTDYLDTGADLDGKAYEYVIVRDTGDATASSDPETALTNLPPVENLTVDGVDGRHATLSWTDPSNNTESYDVLLREDAEGSYSIDGSAAGVGEGETQTYATTELLDGQLYEATIRTVTDDTTVIL